MVQWINLFHCGSLASVPPQKSDGHGMEAYLFSNTLKMIRIEDTFVSAAGLAENRVVERVRKKSRRQAESDSDAPVAGTPTVQITDAATRAALQAHLSKKKRPIS